MVKKVGTVVLSLNTSFRQFIRKTSRILDNFYFIQPCWQGGLSQAEKSDLERIQKTACHIILGQKYESYNNALQLLELDTLEYRRNLSSLQFALKAEKHEKFQFRFKANEKKINTRQSISKYCNVIANHKRFEQSPLSYLTNLLNNYHSK